MALVLVVTVIASSLITWLASAQIRSPAEVAAQTAGPDPSPILVPVEERVLATKIVTRGTGHYGSPQEVSITPSAFKSDRQVVTTLPAIGKLVASGEVLMTVSGRPVFLFDGRQPSYRDLGPGMTGADVLQLELGLRSAGFYPGRVDRSYDASTEWAVQRLYARNGFAPLVATDAQLDAIRSAERGLIPGARARGGVQFPADEAVFVSGAPARITKHQTALGKTPDGPVLTVTDSVVSIDSAVRANQADLVKMGALVEIDEPGLGVTAKGKVTIVAERPGLNGTDSFHVFFRVAVDGDPPALVGASVRLVLPIKSTGTAQLVVPVSALSLGPDGGPRVQRSAGGKLSFVPVRPGLSADGYVAVVPGGPLAAGDRVVVGYDEKAEATRD
jgi:peptidoglycan hydrolase-like protein with peptidoglycan-binding domain